LEDIEGDGRSRCRLRNNTEVYFSKKKKGEQFEGLHDGDLLVMFGDTGVWEVNLT
jgi:hypothetical protein